MGFHKRHIDNEQVINLYKSGGVDALILETGLASDINSILCDPDWQVFGSVKINEEIVSLINKELGIEEFRT